MNISLNLKSGKKTFFIILSIVMIAFLIASTAYFVSPDTVHGAVKPWHSEYLDPGDTYNVKDSHANTTVYINKAGSYYLKGSSGKCRIVIKSGGVNLYLKDGLDIHPGITSYVGSRTAAITVEDQGGTVKLISE